MIATVILKNPHTEKKKLENNFRTPDNAVLWQLDDRWFLKFAFFFINFLHIFLT